MPETVIHYRFVCRRGDTSAWEEVNETLKRGEIGVEWVDGDDDVAPYIKIGNGYLPWKALPYLIGPHGTPGASGAHPPFELAAGEEFYVGPGRQALYHQPITLDPDAILALDGMLIEV